MKPPKSLILCQEQNVLEYTLTFIQVLFTDTWVHFTADSLEGITFISSKYFPIVSFLLKLRV